MKAIARVYVGTYGKYNNGSIEGEWVDLLEFSDKDGFLERCAEIHEDEEDPEFMFQDIEADEFLKEYIDESGIEEELWEAAEALENTHLDEDVINAFISCFGKKNTVAETIEAAEGAYCGEFDSDAAFAEDFAEQVGAMDRNATWPQTCIDWEWAARDLMYDHSEHNGHYFRSNW